MNEYEKQASDFLEKTGSKLEVRFSRHGLYFPSDKDERDIFEVKLSRGSREYVFTYGDSIANYEELLRKIFQGNIYYAEKIIATKTPYDSRGLMEKRSFQKMRDKMSEWNKAGENNTPTAYSILASLEGRMYCDNVDDFADEFGYTKPSEALKVFEAVKKQADELQKIYNDEELEELSNIN